MTTIVCTHNGISTALDVHDDSEIKINGVCAHTPDLDEPEKPNPLSESIQVGDVWKCAKHDVERIIDFKNSHKFVCHWTNKDGSVGFAEYPNRVLDTKSSTLVSRAADKPLHERIVIGKTVLRFPDGQGEHIVDSIAPIQGDPSDGYKASWISSPCYWRLSRCEIVSGAR